MPQPREVVITGLGALTPVGKVFVHGEYWNAKADAEIPVGERVKVVGYDGMCLKVSRLS